MRHLIVVAGMVSCLAFASCGGGGGGGGDPDLNQYEAALVGNYELVGFELFIDDIWYDELDFDSWAGVLSLYDNLTYDGSIVIEGNAQDFVDMDWSATAITFFDGAKTAAYTFDGTILVFDYTFDNGYREIDYWQRVP